MAGAVLDSHALYWMVSGEKPLSNDALFAIGQAQISRRLYVSPITAWELALASKKPPHKAPPNLGGTPATARARRVPLITQDATIIAIGLTGFVDVITC